MAIATLAKVVNNADVFTGVVKIRKGRALQLLTGTHDMRVRTALTAGTGSTGLWKLTF